MRKRTDTVQRFITQNYTAVPHGTELVKAEGKTENFTRVRWADLWISVGADAALPSLIAGISTAPGDAETGPSVAHAAAGIT
jgi:hypothetical protein